MPQNLISIDKAAVSFEIWIIQETRSSLLAAPWEPPRQIYIQHDMIVIKFSSEI